MLENLIEESPLQFVNCSSIVKKIIELIKDIYTKTIRKMNQKSKFLSMEEMSLLNIPDRFPLLIYKALSQLNCDNCENIIQQGDIFCRSANKSGTKGGIRYIRCQKCSPIS